ncbi:peptidase T [Blastopirellula sp. JC732]|uniref:Peptidase T n=1 Tax=Blastopirellula sediminis TaxID=2894196 RepID=A0A9X1MPM4_9BACT|nr:peptidase T [Blastopirellula sediminis]MCC9607408.1 peptidase T [Blastopirellula sediminis]MCC9629299.1 peptidase T [Blastopirellula sediminis]
MTRKRLLDRFLRYVQVDTTAGSPGKEYPSSKGQLQLGKLLAEEIRAFGISNAEQDEYGVIYAEIPGNVPDAPAVAFCAHMDTSPETTGANVKPQVIQNYEGGDIVLPGDPSKVIRESENPELADLHGATLITTDGTTLLGGDDKAGIAVILEMAERLMADPQIPHGPVKILLTCDEEIGHGVDHVDLKRLAADVCYTLDGGGADEINAETFSADLAVVSVHGVNIHPSIAKGRMVNALRAAGMFLDRLPRDMMSPETTAGRDGFIHPVHVSGGVAEVEIQFILRSFDTQELENHEDLLNSTARSVEADLPGCKLTVVTSPQYRNMREGLEKEPRALAYAIEAHTRLSRTPKLEVIRGGTDGSILTEQGLPTPNLSTGQHNPHSPLEWACLDEMEKAVELLISLVGVWAEKK